MKKRWWEKINKKERKHNANKKNDNETTLGINYGERCIKIASANMGDVRNNETLNELDIRMEHAKVDILCIQETHNTQNEDKKTKNYRYISSAALPGQNNENNCGNKGIGGVAILIKQSWNNNVKKIERHTHRCMKITMETGIGNKKLHILNTYAPHMGYRRKDRDEYWSIIKKVMGETPENDLVVWTTDNNGQIARTKTTSEEEEGNTLMSAHIGRWHYASETEKGNGEKLIKILNKFSLTATNTIHPPKNNDKENLIAWTSGGGKINKQLDYIMISNNMKNWLNFTKTKGTADINGANQHKILYMELRVKFKQNEKGKT